ncbi:RluA family pseudouridine synthase [Limobrevibacterium gyesilva]|uniref:Pseudouridine synthase n=1 Tax=Limobrevibacterium gyesilva TaxID=2991712 RepID=A0AA41YJ67_9PROT|nr:RluA family pseudouridine synthase [Limobrevibacterium gyesilva]MCW3472987.1 RluA family pseudouridine synthase [Limobrevibacterium gyesilva]
MSVTTHPVSLRKVTDDEADIRLDRWFRRHFPAITQGAIQKLCRTGQVRVDGKRADAATRLLPGQAVRIPPLPTTAAVAKPVQALDPREQKDLERMVLYRDDHVIVLDKPQGLPTQGGPGITRHLDGMLDGLRFGSEHRPRLVHRLDRETSGVLVVARTPGVAAKLAAAFRGRTVEKTYWAVVVGRPVPPEGRIALDMVRTDGFRGERAAVAGPYDTDTAHSITDFRTLDHAGRKLAWLELSPLTGRTHQLRVHCAAIGAPILGDLPYGTEREGRNTALVDGLSEQLHLHARRISLPHPAGGRLTVEAELPPHMAETFRTLGFSVPAARPAVRR